MSETAVARQMTFGQFLTSTGTQNLIQKTLGDPAHAQRFTAAILSAVSVNPALQKCTPKTILSGAFLGDALNLSPSPQLGHFYLVPFDKKDKQGNVVETNAVFVPGYRGYIQLAIRSGQYRRIVPLAIKEGEIVSPWNPLFETIALNFIEDEDKRDAAPTVGYYLEFELVNGFRKAAYWSKQKMMNHADHYSKAFRKASYKLIQEGKIAEKDMWRYSSPWYEDFDGMGMKTLIRQILPKWGPMSIDMQRAFDADEKIISGDATPIPIPDDDPPYIEGELLDEPPADAPDFVKESEKGKAKLSDV